MRIFRVLTSASITSSSGEAISRTKSDLRFSADIGPMMPEEVSCDRASGNRLRTVFVGETGGVGVPSATGTRTILPHFGHAKIAPTSFASLTESFTSQVGQENINVRPVSPLMGAIILDLFGNSMIVIPAEAGIQRGGVNSVRLDSGFRRNDGVWSNLSTDWLYTGNEGKLVVFVTPKQKRQNRAQRVSTGMVVHRVSNGIDFFFPRTTRKFRVFRVFRGRKTTFFRKT